ncbi:hypothetical protein FMM75_11735 [Lachnospiraceae bacterium MD335]|nr:hypothetical protein [Lachnospiraceae bacterium MD335]
MGFISFSLDYYKKELQKLESVPVSAGTIYRAKQLLKMLDDLVDEGYTELNEKLEEACQGVSRLRKYLNDNHAKPFPIYRKPLAETDVVYEQKSIELAEAIKELTGNAEKSKDLSKDAFLTELLRFCEWVGYEENTAYIFLLRDTLLPYIYYQGKNRKSIYPWLLGRKTLTMLTGTENVDDAIRASIIKALEFGKCSSFEDFCGAVLPDIQTTLKQYPEIGNCLTALLEDIQEKRIIVVESGCSGTFPMLLMSLDDRIDVRMYTTYPYLLEIYGDKIYSPKYEENRLFETLYSQDLYFRFSDLKDGHFFISKCENKEVEKYALAEVKATLNE